MPSEAESRCGAAIGDAVSSPGDGPTNATGHHSISREKPGSAHAIITPRVCPPCGDGPHQCNVSRPARQLPWSTDSVRGSTRAKPGDARADAILTLTAPDMCMTLGVCPVPKPVPGSASLQARLCRNLVNNGPAVSFSLLPPCMTQGAVALASAGGATHQMLDIPTPQGASCGTSQASNGFPTGRGARTAGGRDATARGLRNGTHRRGLRPDYRDRPSQQFRRMTSGDVSLFCWSICRLPFKGRL